MIALPRATAVLEQALALPACSAIVAEVGRTDAPVWRFAAGRLGFDAAAPAVTASTIFDLASLTKVLATTTLALDLAARGVLDVERRVGDVLPEWRGEDRADVRIRDLLEHASGLPAHREYFQTMAGRAAYLDAIAREPLEYAPRRRAIYSDLGFIVLGLALERLDGRTLDLQLAAWRDALRLTSPLAYCPPSEWAARTALTEHDHWRGRPLQGEVHDENAAALGGVAAHAGLFGTADAVGEIARWWLQLLGGRDDAVTGTPADLARRFATPSAVPDSSRALGWDTMRPTSSCGTRMSARAIGHTGFTGTSLWIDPASEIYAVLLTNRVHPTRHNDRLQAVRRAFHDAVMSECNSTAGRS